MIAIECPITWEEKWQIDSFKMDHDGVISQLDSWFDEAFCQNKVNISLSSEPFVLRQMVLVNPIVLLVYCLFHENSDCSWILPIANNESNIF